MSVEVPGVGRCYEGCNCACGVQDGEFDRIIAEETRLPVTLVKLCRSNIGWLTDKSLGDVLLSGWGLSGKAGVYLLWHKNEYCAGHDRFHMRALYVGKGPFYQRFYDHCRNKDLSAEMLVYWTFCAMPNRQAKYVEQLLLDLYRFPFNAAENTGTGTLCGHLTQVEVD